MKFIDGAHETVSLAGRHAEWLLRLAAAPSIDARAGGPPLKVRVQASFAESQQRYGSPRIHADLIAEQVSFQEDGLKLADLRAVCRPKGVV